MKTTERPKYRTAMRRLTSGVRTPRQQEERLAEKFHVDYKAWLKRRGLPEYDMSPGRGFE